jgi:hypothetical protein
MLISGCAQQHTAQVIATTCDMPSEQIRRSILRIQNGPANTASGVVIGADTIITVAHAIDPQKPTTVMLDEKPLPAVVNYLSHSLDLAVLTVSAELPQAIPISTAPLSEMETLWAIGFPLALDQKVSLGYYEKEWNGRLYTTNHVNSGVSGGGLLRCEMGEFALAGVVHGYVALKRNNQTINLGDSTSVPSLAVANFLQATQRL